MNTSTRPFVLAALLVALAIGAGLAHLASEAPDGLESAIVKTHCAEAPDPEACLEEAAGEPALAVAPAPLDDYEVTWLSGLAGVAATFLLGAALVALVRAGRRGGARDRTSSVG